MYPILHYPWFHKPLQSLGGQPQLVAVDLLVMLAQGRRSAELGQRATGEDHRTPGSDDSRQGLGQGAAARRVQGATLRLYMAHLAG